MKMILAAIVLGMCFTALVFSWGARDKGGVLGFLAATCGYAALILEMAS